MNTDCINLIDIVVFMLTSVVHQVFIHMSIIWICVVSSVRLASRQKLCVTKTLMLNMPGKSFNHIFLYLPCSYASLISTILCHFH